VVFVLAEVVAFAWDPGVFAQVVMVVVYWDLGPVVVC
jgi:hypothetical protein